MNGNITSNGNASITEYGFLWSTAAGNFSNTLKVGTDNHSGSFTATLGSLAAGTTYYLQAYARNEAGTSKGAVMTFTTAAALPPPVNPTHPFSDVPASYWAGSVINNLSSLGYISGYPDGTFRPGNRITRAELVTIVDKVLKLAPYTPQTPTFSDVNPSDWFYPVMETAVHAGVVKGYGDGTFHPDAPVSSRLHPGPGPG